jgi:hypothetical protein
LETAAGKRGNRLEQYCDYGHAGGKSNYIAGSNTQPGSMLYLAYVHLAVFDAVNAMTTAIGLTVWKFRHPILLPRGATVEAAYVCACICFQIRLRR